MKFQNLLPLALAGFATAQDSSSEPSLAEALASQNETLSVLSGLLETQPELVSALSNLTNITILAPSNDALSTFLNDSAVVQQVAADPGSVVAILSYHVLNGSYRAEDLEDVQFVPTLLTNETYTNVTGGQVVEVRKEGDDVTVYSALKAESNVTTADIAFSGGVIHIIDSVLRIPQGVAETAVEADLTAVAGAVTQADLVDTLSGLEDITIFAPNNGAFSSISSAFENLTAADLASVLSYHVISGTVAYSTTLQNTSIETVEGTEVNIVVLNGTVYVNEARVVLPDVLIANGVVHVIDSVLNPNNTGDGEVHTSTTEAAFSGATSVADGGIPFTSGVAAPTGTATDLVTGTSTQAGVPQATAAIALGALFGGAAMVMNL